MVARLEELHAQQGRRVSLIGWSLGGIYARELARRFPSLVRQVITLASPFRDVDATNVPRFLRTAATRRPLPDQEAMRARLSTPLPVPSTAIYSRSDAIVAWQSCREDDGPLSENIEVASSHLGIGHHPIVLLTIADRLAQPEGAWRPFEPPPHSVRSARCRAGHQKLHRYRPPGAFALDRESGRSQEARQPVAEHRPCARWLAEPQIEVHQPAEPRRAVEIGGNEAAFRP